MTTQVTSTTTYRVLFALMLSTMIGLPAFAQTTDPSKESYKVIFEPLGNRPIVFRDEDGNFIGNSADGADLEMKVDGSLLRQSITNHGIDVTKLLSQLSPVHDKDGNQYIIMKFPLDTYTAEGRHIEAGTKVMLSVADFYVSRAVQPTGANDDVQSDVGLINKFTDVLANQGVTAPTRPADDAADEAVTLPTDPRDKDEVGDELDESPITAGIIAPQLGYGNPYPSHFLSAPTCSCTAGTCGVSSGFGRRRRPHTRQGLGSAYHQGLDIRGGMSTPIISAAPGCVNFVGVQRGYGFTVVLDHGNGFQTQYGHLKSYPTFKNGRRLVKHVCMPRGTQIGRMGSTGRSNGPHVHFEVHKDKRRVDPRLSLLSYSGSALSHSCSDQPDFSSIDRTMADDLRSGRGSATAAAGSSHHHRHHGSRRAQ